MPLWFTRESVRAVDQVLRLAGVNAEREVLIPQPPAGASNGSNGHVERQTVHS